MKDKYYFVVITVYNVNIQLFRKNQVKKKKKTNSYSTNEKKKQNKTYKCCKIRLVHGKNKNKKK